ncbi:MAG: DUF2283 domain-containing protein [candidate division KSB1 bacterium]|nr:DUF2283 domain-containing protein [candidate division KSB1 bacterium]MDQ7064168.1 DUF2283 domain-containing protein [candidate division KSB1 bacterium]
MATTTLTKDAEQVVQRSISLVSDLVQLPADQMWIDYDREADVLYISFRKLQRAQETIELDDDILIIKDGDQIVGITILHASQRNQ